MNAQHSLDIITEMVSAAQANHRRDSFFYLLWGWIVAFAGIAEFTMRSWNPSIPAELVWLVAIPAGSIGSIIGGIRQERNQPYVRTSLDRFVTHLLMGFVGLLTLAIAVGITVNWNAAYAVFIAAYSCLTVSMGGILRFRPLVVGGICAFPLSIVALLITFPVTSLVLSAAIVISYVIPGHVLRRRELR